MALEKKVKWLFVLVVAANLVIVLVVVMGAFKSKPPKPDSKETASPTNSQPQTNAP